MLIRENYLGKITLSDSYLKSLVCRAVSGCFGVAGMASGSLSEYILNGILKLKCSGTGVSIITKNNEITVNLHISVTYGTNISAVVSSVKNKVEFVLSEQAGVSVGSVNVFVDDIKE